MTMFHQIENINRDIITMKKTIGNSGLKSKITKMKVSLKGVNSKFQLAEESAIMIMNSREQKEKKMSRALEKCGTQLSALTNGYQE